MMVPYKDNGFLTARQKNFNRRLSSTRVIVEQAIGRLKGCFRRLKFLNIYKLENVKYIVTASCILHNICINNKLDYDYNLNDLGNEEMWNIEFEGIENRRAAEIRNNITLQI